MRFDIISGFKKTIPLMLGVIPFGLAYGVMSSQVGLSITETTLMSLVVFAGSAQFMAIGMISQGVGLMFIIFSTLLINLRHLLMGLSLAPYLNKLKSGWLYTLAFGMVDESYATTITHYQNSGSNDGNPYFMLGSEMGMYLFWVGSSVVGGLLGHSIKDPLAWGLDFAMPATFLSILIPQLKSLRNLLTFFTAGICTIIAHMYIPDKWYIIIATIVAAGTGTIMEMFEERRTLKCSQTI